jgi:hypothetical protein
VNGSFSTPEGADDVLPAWWPIWAGSKSAQLIAIPGELLRRPLTRTFMTWSSRSGRFTVGPFAVTPILTDHSAFDAYMLLIEADGKRILYTGDFRRHGRKSVLVDRMIAKPPADIDVLIIEGTNLGTDKPARTEQEPEEDFIERMARFGIAAGNLVGGRHVIMLRRALIPDYEMAGVAPNADDAYNFSMWNGYLSEPYHSPALEWCQTGGGEGWDYCKVLHGGARSEDFCRKQKELDGGDDGVRTRTGPYRRVWARAKWLCVQCAPHSAPLTDEMKPDDVARCQAALDAVKKLGIPREWASEWMLS